MSFLTTTKWWIRRANLFSVTNAIEGPEDRTMLLSNAVTVHYRGTWTVLILPWLIHLCMGSYGDVQHMLTTSLRSTP